MIVKSGKGYKVKSEGGKNLSRTLPTRAAAEKRLRQVEYFKHKTGYDDPKHSHPFSKDPDSTKCLICGQSKSMHHIK